MPTLSVIIPVYNGEKFLAGAVKSVLNQSCKDLEIIIVDDGSTDGSYQIAERLRQKCEYIQVFHTENEGVSHARNIGIEAAKGSYLAFLDADDEWCKNAYTDKIEERLLSHQYDIVSFGYFLADEKLKYGEAHPEEDGVVERNNPYFNYVAKRQHFSAYLYKRELFECARFPEGIRYGEDTAFLFLITRAAKNILRENHYLFMYRTNADSVMNRTTDFNYALDVIDGLHAVKQFITKEEDLLECDTTIYKMMYNYLTLSSKNGSSYKKLYQDMMGCKPFWEAVENVEKNNVDEKVIAFLKQFREQPEKTCRELRRKGFLRYTIRTMVRKTLLRKAVLKIRYKTPLGDYVC